jgi:1-acyl-sn-glycerol-3-phosphate acyltransferase
VSKTPARRRSAEIRWRVIAFLVLPIFGAMVKLRIREGSALPATGPFILSPNHYSEIDPIRDGCGDVETSSHPSLSGQSIAVSGPGAGLADALHRTNSGGAGSVVPAGATTRGGQAFDGEKPGSHRVSRGHAHQRPNLWPMQGKSGAVRMALEQNIPLYPAAHWGTQHWMGRYAKTIRFFPRTTIDAVVGEPFDLSAYRGKPLTKELLQEATTALMHEIAALVGSLRAETPPKTLHDGRGEGKTR